MKSKIINYLRSISQEPFTLSSLDVVEEGKIIQFPHSLQVMLQAIERKKGQWWGLIQDAQGRTEWARIEDPSWKGILNDRKKFGFKPVPVSMLKIERQKSSKRMKQGVGQRSRGNVIIHLGIYDNKWLVNASSFGSYLRCPRIAFLKYRGLYQHRSVAAVKGNLIHEFHVSLYQHLNESHRSDPRKLHEIARNITESVIRRSWRDLASVRLTAEDGKRFINTELFINRMLEAPEFIPWSGDQVLSEFWLSSPTFGIQGFVDRLSLLKDGNIAVFELKSGRQPSLKVKAAKYQAAAYALMLLSLGLRVKRLIIEFPEARSPHEERFIIEELLPHYFDRIPLLRNYIYHVTTCREYKWLVMPWKTCTMSCFIKSACQFYCYVDNFAETAVKERCNPETCQFQDLKRSGDHFCMFPKIFDSYPVRLELVFGYVEWFKTLLLEEKRLVQEEINEVILPASERESTGNALSDMEFAGLQDQSSFVLIFQRACQAPNIAQEGGLRDAHVAATIEILPPTRMQPGDPVLITPMDKLPRSPYSFRGHLLHMTTRSIFIEVDPEDLKKDFVDWDDNLKTFTLTKRFRIDLLPSVTTIQTQLRAIDVLARAPFDKTLQSLFPNALKLRNLITFVQEPLFDPLPISILESVNSLPLNKRQKKAIIQTLRSKDFVLIHGPPGSGKTTTICHLMAQVLQHQKEKDLDGNVKKLPILVAGFTRKSVDNIVLKWQQEFSSLGKIVRVGLPASGSEPEVEEVSLETFVNRIVNDEEEMIVDIPRKIQEELDSADIVATTAASALSSILEPYQFQTIIVDEAGQCTEPLTLIALLKGERFVLVGDHIQLPPVVTCKQTAPLATNIAKHLKIRAPSSSEDSNLSVELDVDESSVENIAPKYDTLELSLFSRLFRKYGENDDITIFLNEQYRMHPVIANFASTFYQEPILSPQMENRTLKNWIESLLGKEMADFVSSSLVESLWSSNLPFLGLDTFQKQWYQDLTIQSESAFNEYEADYIASQVVLFFRKIINALRKIKYDNTLTEFSKKVIYPLLLELGSAIGITTPYRTQVMKIRTKFQKHLLDFLTNELGLDVTDKELKALEQSLMIETVDRFQGREKEIMIISLVDSNPEGKISELLQDDRRLNVAITRARCKLIIIGNLTMLSKLPFYRRLTEYLEKNGTLITL